MERDTICSAIVVEFFNFNSHAHVERDMCGTNFGNGAKISTHTLTWSVTQKYRKIVTYIWISTHTLTWSVTWINEYNKKCIDISTHTLTWSVTGILRQQGSNWKFQLTRSRGA